MGQKRGKKDKEEDTHNPEEALHLITENKELNNVFLGTIIIDVHYLSYVWGNRSKNHKINNKEVQKLKSLY
jgi:C4-type Zn-finger protein